MLKNIPLCIFLPKMSVYRRDFNKKKKFDGEPVYNEKYLKVKIKS